MQFFNKGKLTIIDIVMFSVRICHPFKEYLVSAHYKNQSTGVSPGQGILHILVSQLYIKLCQYPQENKRDTCKGSTVYR